METFVNPKEMVEDDRFSEKRANAIRHLSMSDIDPPIRDIIQGFKGMRHCFTIQSCHGHIIKQIQGGDRFKRIDPESGLPGNGLYQIAYLALALEYSEAGRQLYHGLEDISLLDDDFIQFGSAGWFWHTQGFCNSFVIQVEPDRFRHLDRFKMDRGEARIWLKIRELFFGELRKLLGLNCGR